MFRRTLLASIGAAVVGGAAPTIAEAGPAYTPKYRVTRTEQWIQVEVPVRFDIPPEVYERAQDRAGGDPSMVEEFALDYVHMDIGWTVGGRPVDDLPSP